MIAIIDYDAGNVTNVAKSLRAMGADATVTKDHDEILSARAVVLPGVGFFGHAMKKLKESELDNVIKHVIQQNKPFLGICLGLQLLFEESEESPGVCGLGLIKGSVRRFDRSLKVPQIGFNTVSAPEGSRLLRGLGENPWFYFVHSYYCVTEEPVRYVSEYGGSYTSGLERGNLFAVQFHPEKSARTGLRLLENFIRIADEKL